MYISLTRDADSVAAPGSGLRGSSSLPRCTLPACGELCVSACTLWQQIGLAQVLHRCALRGAPQQAEGLQNCAVAMQHCGLGITQLARLLAKPGPAAVERDALGICLRSLAAWARPEPSRWWEAPVQDRPPVVVPPLEPREQTPQSRRAADPAAAADGGPCTSRGQQAEIAPASGQALVCKPVVVPQAHRRHRREGRHDPGVGQLERAGAPHSPLDRPLPGARCPGIATCRAAPWRTQACPGWAAVKAARLRQAACCRLRWLSSCR